MTEEEAQLLEAIRARSSEEGPREVYADWLETRDDPRGAYLRLVLARRAARQAIAQLERTGDRLDPEWLEVIDPSTQRARLTLASGRQLQLLTLEQDRIYQGLLEGLPTRQRNARIRARLAEQAQQRHGDPPLVLACPERPIERKTPYPFGDPASLPPTGCTGRFRGEGRDPAHLSMLTVVWFQDSIGQGIDAAARARLRAIDWEAHAVEVEI